MVGKEWWPTSPHGVSPHLGVGLAADLFNGRPPGGSEVLAAGLVFSMSYTSTVR
jgi:hypothetical protein